MMSDRVRRPVPKPVFGYFRNGQYHAMDVALPAQSTAPAISQPPGENPLLAGAELSALLREKPAAP